MTKRELIFIPKVSTRPGQIVLYNEVTWYGRDYEKKKTETIATPKNQIERKFHNFKISHAAQKNLKDKVNWLYHLSRSRYQKAYSGKEIFNFKINFLTLTLPSKQIHPTSQITNDCFNQFLTEIRTRIGMENYVWRLEFQNNGNVHYHLVTDSFIDYFFCRKIWNRIIEKLGYVSAFSAKMNALTVVQYHEIYGKNQPENWVESQKRFLKGKAEKWLNPPSVDVKVCTSNKAIGLYIAKYFSKKDKSGTEKNPLDNEENSFSLRLWFCSRSLSKLKTVCEFVEAIDFNPAHLIDGLPGVRRFVHQYAICIYYELSKMSDYVKSLMYPYLRNYANSLNYNSA